jgi:5-methylcytosine-specific restriction endonuclease McrA
MAKKDYRRRPEHQALYNSKAWQELKAFTKQRAGGLCERCKADGYITTGVDCHHIVPWETGRTMEEVKRLFFNPNNLRLLCIPCHIKTHQELMSHKAEQVAEKKKRSAERRASWLDPNYEANKVDEDPNKTPI